jgi:hypothetical protein
MGNTPFLYSTSTRHDDAPRFVTRVNVDPSVKVIGKYAFDGGHQLIEVDLNEGLEWIDN